MLSQCASNRIPAAIPQTAKPRPSDPRPRPKPAPKPPPVPDPPPMPEPESPAQPPIQHVAAQHRSNLEPCAVFGGANRNPFCQASVCRLQQESSKVVEKLNVKSVHLVARGFQEIRIDPGSSNSGGGITWLQ